MPVDDMDEICAYFATALTDDALVDAAAERNFEIVRSRLDLKVLLPRLREFYQHALAALPQDTRKNSPPV